MNLFLQCKNFTFEITLDEIKNMYPDDAYYLAAEIQRLIQEEELKRPLVR